MSHIGKNIIENKEQVEELHVLLESKPVLVRIPAGAKNYVIALSDHIPRGVSGVRVFVAAQEGSSARIVVKGDEMPRSFALEFDLAKNSSVACDMEHKADAPTLRILKAVLNKDSRLFLHEYVRAEEFFWARSTVALRGEGASYTDEMRYSGCRTATLDIERAVEHAAPNTASFLDTRGVVGDSAKVLWRGKVRVQAEAGKSSAFQRHDAILTGAGAVVDAAPILEIFAHDVSCKHSASVRRVQLEDIFYMESRGIEASTAKKEILDGFLASRV